MKKKVINKNTSIIILLILLAIPLILPYFHKGFFPTHDGEWAVVRLADMYRSLKDLQLPVRYSGQLNFDYGYPLFNFVYPAPYYLGVVIYLLKVGFVDTIKLLFALSVVLSSITMYLAATTIWKNKTAGIISAFFYIYLPYRIVDLYARGSIGESLSFALFPLIIYFVAKMLDDLTSNRYMIFAVISYAFLILTHNIMALLFSPLLLLFILVKVFLTKGKGFFTACIFIVLSYGLSAFFWLPALVEKNIIRLSQTPIADRDMYFVTLNQLLTPRWGYDLPNHASGFSYQIGLPHVGIVILSIFALLYLWFNNKKIFKTSEVRFSASFVIMTIILVLMMFSFTAKIWETVPLLKEINYPWTLLAPIGFLVSLLAGFVWLQHKIIKYFIVVLCLCNVVFVLPHAKPEFYIDKGDGMYLTSDATTTSSNELMPLWVKHDPTLPPEKKVEIINGEGTIGDIISKSQQLTFTADVKEKSTIRINTIYYPGWSITDGDKNIPFTYDKNLEGVMEITLPPGKHTLLLAFSETPLRLASDGISLLCFAMVIALPFIRRKINYV